MAVSVLHLLPAFKLDCVWQQHLAWDLWEYATWAEYSPSHSFLSFFCWTALYTGLTKRALCRTKGPNSVIHCSFLSLLHRSFLLFSCSSHTVWSQGVIQHIYFGRTELLRIVTPSLASCWQRNWVSNTLNKACMLFFFLLFFYMHSKWYNNIQYILNIFKSITLSNIIVSPKSTT